MDLRMPCRGLCYRKNLKTGIYSLQSLQEEEASAETVKSTACVTRVDVGQYPWSSRSGWLRGLEGLKKTFWMTRAGPFAHKK